MSQPLVSVLIPAYNHERYVRTAVESALGQTHENLELIVIDDASQDGTWTVLQSFQEERLQRYRHTTNRGAPATLNEALSLARGDYIAILNSDDVYDVRRIERLLAAAVRSGEHEIFLFSDVDFIDFSGSKISNHRRVQSYQALRHCCETLRSTSWFFAGNPAMSTSNFFFSRALADRVGDFSPLRYTHDWDWALRAVRYGTPIWVREELLAYRVHGANTLSEEDLWRHIHENSYVQCCALLFLSPPQGSRSAAAIHAEEILLALLRNESLHPVSLLCFLIYALAGVDAKRWLHFMAGNNNAPWLLPRVADLASCPKEVFRSLNHLTEQLQVIPSQAAMLEERWQAMQHMQQEIANRDQWIADLKTLIQEKEQCIASQANMIEERWDIIQQMGREIANRDRQIEVKQAEIAQLNRHPVIRVTRYVKRILAKIWAF